MLEELKFSYYAGVHGEGGRKWGEEKLERWAEVLVSG